MPRRLLPLAVLPALVLAGCSGSPAAPSSDERIRVVASTDVWGDVVTQIGGDAVEVDSIISDPDRDPHEYQADPRDQLAVSRAQLVVVNGGGYDDFLERLLQHAPASTTVVDAVSRVAGAIARELTAADPSGERTFDSRLTAFRDRLAALEREEASIERTAAGKGVAITEPVPLYMTDALGLVNRTPAAFSAAIEEGGDVAPAVLQQQLALLEDRRVAVLAVNEQTSDATTDRVVAAAKAAGIPVVGVRETLPEGQDYLQWMRHDLDAFRQAVAG